MNHYSIGRLGGKSEYPAWGMVLVLVLLLISPFVSSLIPYGVFLICLYRMVRYDAKVFATDYCVLLPVMPLFRTGGGMTLLVWLSLVAAIYYFVRGKIRANGALVCILLLLNYLIIRMQTNISDFVLCWGQMFILFVLLPIQDAESSVRSTKVFCWSLTLSSVYALLVRDSHQIIAIRGEESAAIWGTSIMRFQSLFHDPNYYSTLLIVALALLCKLKETNRIRGVTFWSLGAALTVFGIMTYSKMFFLVFVLLGGVYIIWQFWSRKVFRGVFFATVAVVAAMFLLFSENSPIAIVMSRFTSGDNISDFTTGRTDIYIDYWNALTKNPASFLFGLGMDAEMLRKDPHNLYLEIAYYTGAIGLILILLFYVFLVVSLQRHSPAVRKQSAISKYVVLFMLFVLYMALHGMYQVVTYASFYLAFQSVLITKAEQ